MRNVTVSWNLTSGSDPSLVGGLEREVREGASLATAADGSLDCRFASIVPNTLSLQLSLPGWTKVFSLPMPPEPGAVRAVVESALQAHLGPTAELTPLPQPSLLTGPAPDRH